VANYTVNTIQTAAAVRQHREIQREREKRIIEKEKLIEK
jgi:hypothetical protein